MAKFRKIGILSSGGDAPGMNAAIRAVARKAYSEGVETVGIVGGYKGLIDNEVIELTPWKVSGILGKGGTMLYTARCDEFKYEEGMRKAIETCKKNDIDAIVSIGGDGTFRGATDLTLHGIPTVGIPGTIDNDITATDYSIGFDTAMNTALEIMDKVGDTCDSHSRCHVLEVMGRDCGDIAVNVALAGGASAVVIPEVKFDEEKVIARLAKSRENGRRGFLIIVSEGVIAPDGRKYGEYLSDEIEKRTGIESRFMRLAHVVRGGDPTLRDRMTAAQMGAKAVELLLEGKSDLVMCEENGTIVPTDIKYALILDRMYKKKLKDGDLDAFTPEQIAEMKKTCERRTAEITAKYNMVYDLTI